MNKKADARTIVEIALVLALLIVIGVFIFKKVLVNFIGQ